jgi:hypothetical protein
MRAIKSPIILYATYLHHCSSVGLGNRQLLASLLTRAELYGMPYIVGADMQVDPTIMQEALWSAGAATVVCAPPGPTCFSLACAARIDGCLAQSAVSTQARRVRALTQAISAPHKPVQLDLGLETGDGSFVFAQRSVPFVPRSRPAEPRPAPVRGWERAEERLREALPQAFSTTHTLAPPAGEQLAALEEAAATILWLADEEMASVAGVQDPPRVAKALTLAREQPYMRVSVAVACRLGQPPRPARGGTCSEDWRALGGALRLGASALARSTPSLEADGERHFWPGGVDRAHQRR